MNSVAKKGEPRRHREHEEIAEKKEVKNFIGLRQIRDYFHLCLFCAICEKKKSQHLITDIRASTAHRQH